MPSPWLSIPLDEYEAHMALPAVAQADMLAEEVEIAVRQRIPASCAIVGCAGGNGFEELAVAGVRRIVGIDINSAYVAAARARHANLAGLELHVADGEQPLRDCAPVELLFVGLVFEYLDAAAALATFSALCVPGGTLVVVLQGVVDGQAPVTPSPYTSLQSLAGRIALHDPHTLAAQADVAGFSLRRVRTRTLPSGKRFEILTLARRPG